MRKRTKPKVLQGLLCMRKRMFRISLFSFAICGMSLLPLVMQAQETRTVSIDFNNQTVLQALQTINRLSGNVVNFQEEIVAKETKKVSLQREQIPVWESVRLVLEGTALECRQSPNGKILVGQKNLSREEIKKITGTVLDSRKQPIPGVTVMLQGTPLGVVTNAEGRFSFEVLGRGDITLLFSFVGMKSVAVKYTGQKDLHVVMEEEVTEIDEVVVTGYQTLSRSRNTGAITSVDPEKIMRPGITTIDQMLEGQVPDLMFMSNSGEVGVVPKLRIRGTSTLIGNREPLWVVDGITVQDPVEISPEELNNPDYVNRIGNAIAGLNPQDIERIDVLKDAAATALYGIKAANGVIVITTKKGHVGKPVISYNMNLSYKRRPRYTDRRIDLMNSKERIEFSKDLVNSGYVFPSSTNMVGYEGLLNQLYTGVIDHAEFAKELQRLEAVNTDWFDLLTEDVLSHQHTLSISGGSKDMRYYASVGYAKDNDVIKGNNNERYTVALNLNANLSPKVSAALCINANVSTREYSQEELAPMDYAYNTSRAIPAYEEDGDYEFYQRQSTRSALKTFRFNMLHELENSSYTQEGSAVSANVTLNAQFTDWLNASAIGSYSTSLTDIQGWWGEKSYHVACLRGTEFEVPPVTGEDSDSELPYGGELTTQSTRNRNWMVRVQVNADKYFHDDMYNLSASIGFEASSTRYKGYDLVSRGYYEDRGKQFSITSLDDYPIFKDWMENYSYPTITDNLTNLVSAYATVSWSYRQLLTLNANARFDGSNKFGDQSNDKLLPIWSVSANYTISEHSWLQKDWIDYIMLKLSYGFQGNMLEDQSPTMIIRQEPVDPLYNELVSDVEIYPNPDLRWEKTASFNGGLTFSLFHARLQMEASAYYKRTKDAFLSKTISTVNGLEEYVVNSGTLKNTGYSISATVSPIRTRNFNWLLATSFSNVFNKMETQPGTEQYELENFLNGTALIKNEPVGTFYSYKFVGLDPKNGYPIFDDMREHTDELEQLSKYDFYTTVLKETGSREPTMSGNISNTFTYKNWRLNMNLAYSLGSKIRLFHLFESTIFNPEDNVPKEFVNRWRKPGDERYTNIPNPDCYESHWSGMSDRIPRIANNNMEMYNYSDIRVVSGNYLKCSTMSLTYEFPLEKIEKIGLTRLALSLSGTNLFTIASPDLKGQAPQQSGFAQIELSDRPAFTLGLNVSF